jgi:hypothetical protein
MRASKKGGRWITPIPPFHRGVFLCGLACLAVWLPFGVFEGEHGIVAGASGSVAKWFQSASGELSASLYTLGYWLTVFGVGFEVAYIGVGGLFARSIENQEFMDASGRSRFLRGKRKTIRTSDPALDGKRVRE